MKDIITILKSVGAIQTDSHFVGTSGRHMPAYINKDQLTTHTTQASAVGRLFAEKYKDKKIDVVAAPAVAGIPLSQWTAYHLSKLTKRDVLSVYTEKTPDNDQIFKRGYDHLVKGKRVLVIEDIATTGGSIKKVIARVQGAGGKVVGASVMVNRDPKIVNSKSIGAPFTSLGVFSIPSYEADACPLCKKGVPVNTSLGHGKKFMEAFVSGGVASGYRYS
jgi:orotate phosphoribosyltransferase